MRYFTTTSMSRASMWISLARRSRAVKITVSTSRTTGLTAVSCVRRSGKERILALFFVLHHLQREGLGGLFEHALGLLGALQKVADLSGSGDLQDQLLAEQQRAVRRSAAPGWDRPLRR